MVWVPWRTYSLVQLRGWAARSGNSGCVRSSACIPGFSSTHSTNAFSGGFKYSPTMSNNFGSNSGSGLKVKVRMRWGCSCEACRIACTVLGGRPTFRANVRTVQRPCASGCWQAKVCTFCQTAASCFGGRPERGASRNPSNPNAANERRHFPTVIGGSSRSEAICWFGWPAAAAKTIRLRSTSACAVDGACTQRFKVVLVFASRRMAGAIRGMSQRTRSPLYYKELSGRCTRKIRDIVKANESGRTFYLERFPSDPPLHLGYYLEFRRICPIGVQFFLDTKAKRIATLMPMSKNAMYHQMMWFWTRFELFFH